MREEVEEVVDRKEIFEEFCGRTEDGEGEGLEGSRGEVGRKGSSNGVCERRGLVALTGEGRDVGEPGLVILRHDLSGIAVDSVVWILLG